MMLAKLWGAWIRCPPAPSTCVGRGLKKGKMTLAHPSIPGENFPDPYPLCPCPEASQFISSPKVPGTFPVVAALKLREQASLCSGPLRGTLRTLEALCFTQPQPLLVFTARSCGDFFSWHWSPGLGRPVWGRDPLLSRGDLQIQVTALIS